MCRRVIQMQNIVNCRDLGGYPCAGGGATRFGRALRCGVPKNPSESDFKALSDLGVRTVIDLRGNGEAAEMPSAFIGREEFDYHRISLFEANPAAISGVTDMSELYAACVTGSMASFREVFSLIAGLNSPFMFHCFLGKDRTGMVAALLLAAAGADRQSIIADYIVSAAYLAPFYKREIESESGLLWEQDETHLGSPAKNIECALDLISGKFGGVSGFFNAIGLTAQEQERISKVLL